MDRRGSDSSTSSSRKRSSLGGFRSVADYESEEELRQAMLAVESALEVDDMSGDLADIFAAILEGEPVQKIARISEMQCKVSESLDWVLPRFDHETEVEQSMDEEIKRLMVLKSYILLDSTRDDAFDRITSLAARIFDVPIAFITLVDLGRQFLLSHHGVDLVEHGRREGICAHTIMAKENILVVPDLSKDFRFCDNPFVTGEEHVRFYAGVPLLSPEGYKLGTLCILDTVARHQGISDEQRSTLKELAEMAVKVMVDRRYQMQNEKPIDPTELVAYTANDLLAPLSGVQLSLSILREDESLKAALGEHRLEILNTAASTADLIIRICQNAVECLIRMEESATSSQGTQACFAPRSAVNDNSALTRLDDVVKSLLVVVDPMPKHVPCIISLHQDAPTVVLSNELKLIRCALNLLTNAVDRTTTGSIHLSIRAEEDTHIIFECEDTGSDIPVEEYQYLFQNNGLKTNRRVGLSSIASLVNSLDGEYGFRPRGIDADGTVVTDSTGCRQSGSVFWFSVPLRTPGIETIDVTSNENALSGNTCGRGLDAYLRTRHDSKIVFAPEDSTGRSLSSPVFSHSDDIYGVELGMLPDLNMESVGNCDEEIARLAMATVASSAADLPDEDSDLREILEQLEGIEPYPITRFASANVTGLRRKRVLIIDDSTVVRKNLEHIANSLEFDAVLAANGTEGLNHMQQSQFDIVLCDMVMPIMDGAECVAQYREWEMMNRPWDHQLIVAISAHKDVLESERVINAGMDMFFSKPITLKTFTDLQGKPEFIMRAEKLNQSKPGIPEDDFLYVRKSGSVDSPGVDFTKFEGSTVIIPSPPPSRIVQEKTAPICLLASTLRQNDTQFPHQLDAMGWKLVTINDGHECLMLLQSRVWDAVLIDDDLPQLSGVACIAAFRKWEVSHRLSIQKNVFLVCDGDIPSPSDKQSFVQPPSGCNGVLRRPVPWFDFLYLIDSVNVKDRNGST